MCSCSVGCRVHSKWNDSYKMSAFYHERPGFRDISYINTYTYYGNDQKANQQAKEILCMLANHEILNKVMKAKRYPPKMLEELNPNDYTQGGYCLGLNFDKGTNKISIRLRTSQNVFFTHDELISTMLHELTHMDESGHGPGFIKKQDELRALYNSCTRYNKIDFNRTDWGLQLKIEFNQYKYIFILLFLFIFYLIFR